MVDLVAKSDEPLPRVEGFDPKMAGRKAECDGGGPVMGGKYGSRQDFAGTLTGDYVDHGDPPWRWYLMKELTTRPEGYGDDAVWCESNNLFFDDE